MKRIVLSCLIVLLSQFSALACDICGCGVGSYYLGILPEFNKRFAGFRYQHKALQTHLGPTGNRTPLTNDEVYESIELWTAWNLGEKWRIMAILPYNFNRREIPSAGETGRKDGLGDVALMGYYRLFETTTVTSNYKFFVHSLWAGVGVKAPTGMYDQAEQASASQGSPNNFQLGTASTDFMLNAAYDARLMDLGMNVNVNYKINTQNTYDFRYGNKLTANSLVYYKFNIKNKVRIAPNVGLMYERQQKDELYGRYNVAQSGGYVFTLIGGVELNLGKISLGFNYQSPASQNLAEGRVLAGNRLMTHLSFGF